MKLLLISVKSTISRGGIAAWTDRFLAGCEAHGIEYTLVNTEGVGKRAEGGTFRRNFFDEILRTQRIFRDLKERLRDNTFDMVHLNTSCGNFGIFRDYLVARKIARKGIPVVTHYHCDIPYWIHNSLNRKCLEKLAKLSRKNLVLCENSRRYLEEQFGVASVIVPNFIEDNLVRVEPKSIADKLVRVLFVGRVSESKGAKELYALAKRFEDITFELVGDVAEPVTIWEKPANVLLSGGIPHEKVIERLDQADVFLLPSRSEGFSVALLESMARGIPAVATNVGANADMLCDGCGIVVNKGDVDAIEKALESLRDKQTRQNISQKAIEKVRSAYTTDAVISLIKRQYR